MVIFLKGILETLDQFIDAMAADAKEDHIVINVRKMNDLLIYDSKINSDATVITFNNVGLSLFPNNSSCTYWESKGVTFFNILVDHPFFYTEVIDKFAFEKLFYVCIDECHVDYLRYIYPERADSFFFLPHGGTISNNLFKVHKDIDILYVGSCQRPDPLPSFDDAQVEMIFSYIKDYYANTPNAESFKVVKDFFKEMSLPYDKRLFTDIIQLVLLYEQNLTGLRRSALISALASHRFNITVCGPGYWNDMITENNFTNIDYKGKVSPEECIDLIARSKIVINDSPFFFRGSHERVFNGMLNQAVVLTNESSYLKSRFADKESILYWNGKDIGEAIAKVADVLSNTDYRKEIIKNAASLVNEDTWGKRSETLIAKALELLI